MSDCPRDTNGDGNCGWRFCPWCGDNSLIKWRRDGALVKAVMDSIYGKGRAPGRSQHLDRAVRLLDDIPDNWAKVDGDWVHLPEDHFLIVEMFDRDAGRSNYFMEHSLPCRVRGMEHCPEWTLLQQHLDEGGHLPRPGRHRFWINPSPEGTPEEDDGRTIEWEAVDVEG